MGSVLMRSGVAMLAALVVGASAAAARPLAGDPAARHLGGGATAGAAFVEGQVIVQFRSGASAVSRARALSARNASVSRGLGRPGLTLVQLPRGASVQAAVAALERDPSVAFAEPNYVYRVLGPSNDPKFLDGTLWGLDNAGDHDIDAPEAWDTQTGSSTVVVAVIDSGVAYDHPELAPNVWTNDDPPGNGDDDDNGKVDDTHGWDFVQNDNTPLDYYGHGSHVAGTIGAKGNNGADITGVNWDVSIMPVRAGDAYGSLTNANVASAISYACANGAHVVNGSFGGAGKSTLISNAIKSTACKHTLFVFAAGNSGRVLNNNTSATNAYPCEYWRKSPHGVGATNVICVAASNKSDGLASFSNRGKSAVHLAAPGVDIYSTLPEWSPVFSDDLESGFGNWTEGTGQSFPSTSSTLPWQRTDELAQSGSWSMTDSPGGQYANSQNYTIRNSSAVNLTGRIGCLADYELELLMLDFDAGEVYDWFAFERSTSPTGPWTEASFYFGTSQGDFVPLTDDLSALDGQAAVYFRFLVHSDTAVRDGGAHVDDVVVKCLVANGDDYAHFSGTSMASPHVAGVAALLLAQEPAMSPQKLKNAILKGVDKKTALADRVSTGGRLNADKALDIAMDHIAPNTTITGRPANSTRNRRATFRFTSNEAGSTFQCRHMNGAWRACSSPKIYTGLAPGVHTFKVRAIDKNGNVDPTPAADSWRIRR